MSHFSETGKRTSFPAGTISLPDFDVSWAGSALPFRTGLCFGSEDGRIRFMDIDNGGGPEAAITVATTGEAINGVAFTDGMMAVSTRSEVVFWKIPSGPGEGAERLIYSGGSHEVIASRSGRFLAPLGARGILLTGARLVDRKTTTIVKPRGKLFYSYKVADLASGAEGDFLISAARREGIAICSVPSEGGGDIRMLKAPGLDIVDVCGLGSGPHPRAAAALGLDRAVHLIRDARAASRPTTLRFPGLKGRAYRLLSSQGHLFLLTSECLYAFPGLVARFLNDGFGDGLTMARSLELQAVDASLADERLLVVMPDSVISMKIEDFAAAGPESAQATKPGLESALWEDSPSFPLEYAAI